ncbi:MAG: hypothetical protein NT062_39375 [Proteobacteria bacterium]|nr:hypothetical protein [Pseudomonadota bacterium]
MSIQSKIMGVVVSAAVVLPLGFALAKGAMVGHPNLIAAKKACDEAIVKLTDAQKANEYDLGGHAAKAKDLLTQAQAEIKLAAEAANKPDKH